MEQVLLEEVQEQVEEWGHALLIQRGLISVQVEALERIEGGNPLEDLEEDLQASARGFFLKEALSQEAEILKKS